MINELIALIKQFDNENKFYWIDSLKVSDGVKGYLITYFNL